MGVQTSYGRFEEVGALGSGGRVVVNDDMARGLRITPQQLRDIAEHEDRELIRRDAADRGGRLPLEVAGKPIILVDDGLATGASMDGGAPFWEVPIAASTRESFTVNETATGEQYRFVLPGPQLTFREQEQCLEELAMAAASADFVVASGRLPPGVPASCYRRVADVCQQLGVLLCSGHVPRRLTRHLLRGVSDVNDVSAEVSTSRTNLTKQRQRTV